MSAAVADLHALVHAGQLDLVESHCRDLIARNPNDGEACHLRGVVAYRQKRFSDATQWLRKAVELEPVNPYYNNNLGLAWQAAGELESAAAYMRKAIELRPATAPFLGNLANVLNQLEQYAAAESLARAALELDPTHIDAYVGLGAALSYQGLTDQAESCFQRAAELAPDHVDVRRNLGHIHQETGRFDAAQLDYEFCLRHDPTDGDAWYGMVSTRKFQSDDDGPIVARLESALSTPGLAASTRSDLHLAIAKVHDDCGRYDDAFSHMEKSKDVPHEPFDARAFADRIDGWITAFPKSRFRTPIPGSSDSQLPVFIVGMPRSGSTLVEQILGAHRQVYPGGELTDLKAIMTGQRGVPGVMSVDPQSLADLTPETIQLWSQWYLSRRRIAAGDALRVTDKMPINFMFLGLIALLFPHARVIHCRRNPLDCGLSIFAQRFVQAPEYSYRLEDIGRFYGEYESLMGYWRAVLPLKIFEVQYETLVDQPETAVRQLLEFVDLPWDARCLRFHEQRRAVQTASSWQVRQPLHHRSIGRWHNYAEHLEPLVQSLDPNYALLKEQTARGVGLGPELRTGGVKAPR